MANRPAPALVLRPGDREELERVRASTVPASAAKRARIVLLAADGVANKRIAELVDSTVTTVLSWRERYQSKGPAGLVDAPRPGRRRTMDHHAIVAATLKPPQQKLGVTPWSSHHRNPYRPGGELRRRWDRATPQAKNRGVQANRRLHQRWSHYEARHKKGVVANTAIARELAGFCWSLAVMPD